MSSYTQQLQRRVFALGFILLVLVSTVSYVVWQDAQKNLALTPTDIKATRIAIHRTGSDTIKMVKTLDTWSVQSPCSVLANQQRVETLLSALAAGSFQYNAAEVDRAAAGLITPLASVFINDIEHRIGNTDLSEQKRYVQRGDVIELIPEWVLSLISGGVTAMAELSVLPPNTVNIELIKKEESQTLQSEQTIELWQSLSAQQLVSYPPPNLPAQSATTLIATNDVGESFKYSIYHTDKYTVMHYAQAQCAYILPLDTLPE